MVQPKISVCIPSYNRAIVLRELLDSILTQDYDDFEVVIAEDCSPQREEIRHITSSYQLTYPDKIHYFENSHNLGYDGNIRRLFELASGEFLFFMGNDDLMCEGALSKVAAALSRHPNIGVVLRSYAAFDEDPKKITQTFRYFDKELFFPAGAQTISTVYRRSVVIPGLVIHREAALAIATDRFDGILLYQLYLVAEILIEKNAVFLPEITVLYRNGGIPDFGNSPSERGKFTPKVQTPESSLHFIRGMLDIVKYVENKHDYSIFQPILKDIANYSYPLLSIQARQPFFAFVRYGYSLARMGFGRYFLFWCYFLAILSLGVKRVDALVALIKKRLGRTPVLGNVYLGSG